MKTRSNDLARVFSFRMICIREQRFPWLGIDPDLNYDTMSLVKLKTLRHIAKLSEKLFAVVPNIPQYNIKSFRLLNYMVDIKLAVQRIAKLLDTYFTQNKLSLFQMRSLDLLNFFLKEIVSEDVLVEANLGEVFVDEIYNVMRVANELEYPPMPQCNWCGENILYRYLQLLLHSPSHNP